jgi:hypothetical protein
VVVAVVDMKLVVVAVEAVVVAVVGVVHIQGYL